MLSSDHRDVAIAAFEAFGVPALIADPTGTRLLGMNAALLRQVRVPGNVEEGVGIEAAHEPAAIALLIQLRSELIDAGQDVATDETWYTIDDVEIRVRSTAVKLFGDDGEVVGIMATFQDITAESLSAEFASAATDLARGGADPSWTVEVNHEGRVTDLSANAQDLFGSPPAQLRGRPFLALLDPDMRDEYEPIVTSASKPREVAFSQRLPLRVARADGSIQSVEAIIHAAPRSGDEPLSNRKAQWICRFIAPDRTGTLAFDDPLTSLPDRRRFNASAAQAISQQGPACLALFSIRNLLDVSHALGDEAANSLIRAVAARITRTVPGALVSRCTDNAFVVLMHSDEPAALAAARRLIKSISQPAQVAGERVAAVCGAVVCRASDDVAAVLTEALVCLDSPHSPDGAVVSFQPQGRLAALTALRARSELIDLLNSSAIPLPAVASVSLGHRTGELKAIDLDLLLPGPDGAQTPGRKLVNEIAAADVGDRATRHLIAKAGSAAAQLRRGDLTTPVVIELLGMSPAHPELLSWFQAAHLAESLPPDAIMLQLSDALIPDHDVATATITRLAQSGIPIVLRGLGWREVPRWWELPIAGFRVSFETQRATTALPDVLPQIIDLLAATGLPVGLLDADDPQDIVDAAAFDLACVQGTAVDPWAPVDERLARLLHEPPGPDMDATNPAS